MVVLFLENLFLHNHEGIVPEKLFFCGTKVSSKIDLTQLLKGKMISNQKMLSYNVVENTLKNIFSKIELGHI